MNLLHQLDLWDQKLLLFLNGLNCPIMDEVMWQVSSKLFWVPFYAVLIYFLARNRKKDIWITLIAVTLMIVLSDQISGFIKETVQRFRPTHNPVIANMVHMVHNYDGGDYGFVSSHAANSFAVAAFISLFFAKRWVTISMFCWAALVSYSRIYLGVHYPLDITCGALLGAGIGWGMFYAEQWGQKRYDTYRKIDS
jgi:undecaprenyl-diphosphatase